MPKYGVYVPMDFYMEIRTVDKDVAKDAVERAAERFRKNVMMTEAHGPLFHADRDTDVVEIPKGLK